MKPRGKRGMILSIVILILVLLVILGTSMASMGISNLNTALSQHNSERAYQVAEGGLVYAYSDISMANLYVSGTSGPLQTAATYPIGDSRAAVEIFDNSLSIIPNQPAGCPVMIPAGYIYLVSTGKLGGSPVERKAGAMICLGGGGSMSLAVNCCQMQMDQGQLMAWDIKGNSQVTGESVVSTNTSTAGSVMLGAVSPVVVSGAVLLPSGAAQTVLSGAEGSNYSFSGPSSGVRYGTSNYNFPKIDTPSLAALGALSFPGGTLPSGHYTNLVLTGSTTLLGPYVVDNLTLDPGGQIVPDGVGGTQLYVKNQLTILNPSPSALYNDGSSNRLKIYYEGTSALTLNLGSLSHLCLVAPKVSQLNVNASDLAACALAAQKIKITTSTPTDRFCFDPTAAQPIERAAFTTPGAGDRMIPGFKAVTVIGRQRF